MNRLELIKELEKHENCEDIFLELCDKQWNIVYTKIHKLYNTLENELLIQTKEFKEIKD
jgi:hypothetical protein